MAKTDISDFKLECATMFLMNFQAKIPSGTGLSAQEEWQKYTPSSPPLSKDEGLRNIGHSMNIRNLILRVSIVTNSYLIHYNSLFQNVADIIKKCDSYFITKCNSFITKCGSYYKLRQFHYKLRQYTPYFLGFRHS